MIAWNDEAIEAALDSFYGPNWRGKYQETNNEMRNDMRLALDAAVTAQGCILLDRDDEAHHARSYEKGRAEALEEAARVAETNAESDLAYGRRYPDEYYKMEQRARRGRTIAAAIRALKETKG